MCMQAAKAQVSLHICADSPEPLLLDNIVSKSHELGQTIITLISDNISGVPYWDTYGHSQVHRN